jgi:aspartyl-tRNA(Asn)/glutamyl-tRNA(Gln) amidotransferase subunit B
VLEEAFRTGTDPQAIVQERGLVQVSDAGALEGIVDGVLADPKNQKAIADYRGGKENALNSLVGAVMKETRGRANAGVVRDVLKQKLA